MPVPKGVRVGGRQKGTPNKTTASVKDAMTRAFDDLGGVDALVTWGKENQTEFYKLWSKLLPQEVKAEHSGAMSLHQVLHGFSEPPAD